MVGVSVATTCPLLIPNMVWISGVGGWMPLRNSQGLGVSA